jgi:hypothetical protein
VFMWRISHGGECFCRVVKWGVVGLAWSTHCVVVAHLWIPGSDGAVTDCGKARSAVWIHTMLPCLSSPLRDGTAQLRTDRCTSKDVLTRSSWRRSARLRPSVARHWQRPAFAGSVLWLVLSQPRGTGLQVLSPSRARRGRRLQTYHTSIAAFGVARVYCRRAEPVRNRLKGLLTARVRSQ